MQIANAIIHNYYHLPICDNHIHLSNTEPISDTVSFLESVISHFGYEKIQLCALPYYDITNNLKALYCKSHLASRAYASVGMCHHYDERDTADYYLEEIKKYHAMGCDGIKLLDGKMNVRRKLGRKLCDPVFDKFYAYAEECGLPIIIHLGDPPFFWDRSKVREWMFDCGWFCAEDEPTLEELRDEINCILEKFPKLCMIMAHFYFLSEDIGAASTFLDKWENVYYDITPHQGMYGDFSLRHTEWRAFFEKYQDRILYGSDIDNEHKRGISLEEMHGRPVNLVRTFLEKKNNFIETNIDMRKDAPTEITLKPFGFDRDILEKIYYKNFIKLYGDIPHPIDAELVVAMSKRKLIEEELDTLATENLNVIIEYFMN